MTIRKILKYILLKLFKKNSIFIKNLSLIENSYLLLKKINSKYSIILIPIIIKSLFFIIKNRENIFNNKKKLFFEKKYKFIYGDWFSNNIYIWEKFIKKIRNVNYLEIGAFEGRSTVFISELKNTKSIKTVDTWKGSDEHNKVSFTKVFKNFKKNIKSAKKNNINFFKETSDEFFKKNKSYYNLIYIDGSHEYSQVKKDFENSFYFLEKNGYLICDDFNWFFYEDIDKNPHKAIIECYEKYKKNLKIKFLNHQMIFEKIN